MKSKNTALLMSLIAVASLSASASHGQTWGDQTVAWAGIEIGDGGSGAGGVNIDSITVGATTYSGTALQGLTYVGNPGTDAQYVAGTPDLAELYTADLSTAPTADSPAVFAEGPFGTLSSFSASFDISSISGNADPYWIVYLTPDVFFTSPIVGLGGVATLNSSSQVHVGDLTHGTISLGALDSMAYSSPDGTSTLFLLGFGFAGLAVFGYRRNLLQLAK